MTPNDDDAVDAAPLPETADADLVLSTRSGDSAAFGELWRRHYSSGMSVARSITSSIDPDDLVQEAYARIFQSIQRGGGPTGSFRAYLFTSIRNTAAAWGRSRRETAVDELDAVADPASTERAADDALDRSLTHQAFRSLPTRWQEVLWYTEIEQMKPAEIAPLLGMRATAVAQLAFRAREGLREAWVQAHLRSVADGSDCQWTIERLGSYSRNNLGKRDLAKIETHLHDCARCAIVAAEAKEVSGRLVLILLPLTIGIGASAAYLASIQGAGAPIVAMAALPSTLVPGAVVAGDGGGGTTAGAGSAGSASAGSGAAGASVGSAGAAGTGMLAGAGTLTALITAGALVAATVVAAVVVPTVLRTPVTTQQVEAADHSSVADRTDSTSGSVATPSPTPSDIPTLAPVAPAKPVIAPVVAPETTVPSAPSARPTQPVTPTQPTTPSDPGTGPTVPPTDPPTDPTDPTTGPTDPPTDPTTDPTDPPTDPTDPTDPGIPAGTPTLGEATVAFIDYRLTITIPLSGAAGEEVQTSLGDDPATTLTLDESGAGTVVLRPRLSDLLGDSLVTVRYSRAAESQAPLQVHLSDLFDLADIRAAWGESTAP